jgi:hypothetical protein
MPGNKKVETIVETRSGVGFWILDAGFRMLGKSESDLQPSSTGYEVVAPNE